MWTAARVKWTSQLVNENLINIFIFYVCCEFSEHSFACSWEFWFKTFFFYFLLLFCCFHVENRRESRPCQLRRCVWEQIFNFVLNDFRYIHSSFICSPYSMRLSFSVRWNKFMHIKFFNVFFPQTASWECGAEQALRCRHVGERRLHTSRWLERSFQRQNSDLSWRKLLHILRKVSWKKNSL